MNRRRIGKRCLSAIAVLLPSLLLAACLSTGAGREGIALPRVGVDQFRLIEGRIRSVAGCRFDYRVFLPDGPLRDAGAGSNTMSHDPLIMLGHGFLRHQDTLSGLARHLANAGHRVATLEFCNMRPWNGHHIRNGNDMRLLARHLGASQVVYAGFSAGALAALLAAARDPKTVGVITLDLVDQAGLAEGAVKALDVPVLGLAGRASSCNRMGEANRLFEQHEQRELDVLSNASHCEFESPTDGWCRTACGDKDSETVNQSQTSAIIDGVVTRANHLLSRDKIVSGGPSSVVTPPYRQ